ncbi:MAG: BatD family protein, partial [Planctomycetes bacterium]|nr:BatD family protein [Planctomycetota bacterium]
DPIELVVDISGYPIETIPGPDLGANAQLNEDFRVPTEALAGTVRGNSKRFTQVIRAKRADVKEIPPIEFAYFDAEAGEYAVARSEPIPVLVGVVEQLDAADVDVAAQPPQAQGAALEARDGLRGNKTREADLLASTPPVTMAQVVLTTVIPPVAFLCVLGISTLTRSGRDVATRRRRGALRNAEGRIQAALTSKLSPAEFHSEIQAALAGYLADRLNEPSARFLGTAAIGFLQERGADGELVKDWAVVAQRCEQIAYAGGGDSDASLADAAQRCIRRLERERL